MGRRKTALDKAKEEVARIDYCDECVNYAILGNAAYCKESGRMIHPLMVKRGEGHGPARNCENAKRKEIQKNFLRHPRKPGKYPYTFKVEFLLPEPWDNDSNREKFENAILNAFMEAFPDGVELVNKGLYFAGAIQEGHEQTLARQTENGEWVINGVVIKEEEDV